MTEIFSRGAIITVPQSAAAITTRAAGRAIPHWVPLVAIACLALALRLYGLGDKPFWLDELASLHRATISLPDLVAQSLHSKHYPSYFLLLWLVAKLGASQFLLRLPSAVFGAVNAALVAAMGREAAGPRAGAAAGLLMAFSPFDVQYGQEARSYTLVTGLILVALFGLLRLARDPGRAALPLRSEKAPRLAWLAYGAGTASALCVLNVAVPWLLAANLGALAIAAQAGDARRRFLRNWGIVQGIVLALWLPWLVAVYVASKGAVLHGETWAPPESLATIWSIIAPVYLHRITAFITFDLEPAAIPGLSLIIAALALCGAWRLRRARSVFAVIACAVLVLPLLLLSVSLAAPVLAPRYFAWGAAPFFVLAGAGLAGLRGWRFAGSASALGALCLVNLLPYYADETKPRWDLLAARLGEQAQQGDLVLLNDWHADYVLTAFAPRAGLDLGRIRLSWSAAKVAAPPGHDVWAVFGRTGQGEMQTPEAYLATLSALGRPVSEERIGRYIVLWRFHAPGAPTVNCGKPEGCPA
ncbi:MAG: glycosyltransferase family 39 protein [Stellaceae bacterium]